MATPDVNVIAELHSPPLLTEPRGYVFIAGMPRTGTTLLRSLLNCSQDVSISMGESHYLGGPRLFGLFARSGSLHRLATIGDLATDDGAVRIVDHLYTRPQNNFWGPIARSMDRETFQARLLASDRRERELFKLAMICGAKGKPLGGEKTPDHIYAAPTLLEWFPGAHIVHTLRDPRAVYVSNKRKYEQRRMTQRRTLAQKAGLLFELYSSLETIVAWRRITRLHAQYRERYAGHYHLSRYEDLITAPAEHLQQLCERLGVRYTDTMLQQTFTNSSFVPRNQVHGFDMSALDRWRKHLHPAINRWFVMWCRRSLLEFGYQP